MSNKRVHKIFFIISILILAALACNQVIPAPTPTPAPAAPATTLPTQPPTEVPVEPTALPEVIPTETPAPTAIPGMQVSFGSLSLVIPPGLANGASGTEFPRAEGSDIPPWELTPGHIQLKLEGYLLQDKFHQAQFFVYPADAYAALDTTAANNLSFIKGMCCRASNIPDPASLPHIPFFNAGPVFTSNIQIIPFQNGTGVRFITEYAQYFAYVNNHDLFYQYQGLTEDGQYYLIVILPLTAPGLPENGQVDASVPGGGGVSLPDYNNPDADWEGYYVSIAEYLNITAPDAFSPTLTQLDTLIQSILITGTP